MDEISSVTKKSRRSGSLLGSLSPYFGLPLEVRKFSSFGCNAHRTPQHVFAVLIPDGYEFELKRLKEVVEDSFLQVMTVWTIYCTDCRLVGHCLDDQ